MDLATGLYRLNNYEIASLLSYSLWASTPDDSLLTAAEADMQATGGLRFGTLMNIRSEIGNMLNDPSVQQQVKQAPMGGLGLRAR